MFSNENQKYPEDSEHLQITIKSCVSLTNDLFRWSFYLKIHISEKLMNIWNIEESLYYCLVYPRISCCKLFWYY